MKKRTPHYIKVHEKIYGFNSTLKTKQTEYLISKKTKLLKINFCAICIKLEKLRYYQILNVI